MNELPPRPALATAPGLDLTDRPRPSSRALIATRHDMLNPGRADWVPRSGTLCPISIDQDGYLRAGPRVRASPDSRDGRLLYPLADLPDGIYSAAATVDGRGTTVYMGVAAHRLAWWSMDGERARARLLASATHLAPLVSVALCRVVCRRCGRPIPGPGGSGDLWPPERLCGTARCPGCGIAVPLNGAGPTS